MPLSIRFDHRLDRLADALLEHFARLPAHPLAEDVVIVPALGTGRWLQQRVARASGVCARLRLDFAGRYLWRTFGELLPDLPSRSPFDAESARWSVLALFDALPQSPELAPLARRLADAAASDRLALAGEVAQQFARYLAWRRDWLERWQRGRWAQGDAPLGPHEPWQRWLWRELLQRLPRVSQRHPYDRFEQALHEDPQRVAAVFGGRRVALFGAVELSSEQYALFARLAEVIDVLVLAPDPCRELWSDIVDRKALARIRAQSPDVAWLYESEPAVLGNWGRAQRDFVAQLAALEEAAGVQAQAPFRDAGHPLDALVQADASTMAQVLAQPPARLTPLEALQASVFLRSDRPWLLAVDATGHPSLQVHASHGPVRQAEVLHERLLDCFDTMPDLQPGEVLVLCPDIETAGDAIAAVFAGAPAERRIPVAVSGRRAQVESLPRAAIELLQLAAERAPLSGLVEWLANPAVRQALGLDDEAVGRLASALDAAGARWGLEPRDGPPKHNWRAAIDRLLIGAAAGTDQALFGDTAAVAGLRGAGAEAFERLLPVLGALAQLQAFDRQPQPVADWCALVRRVLEPMFGAGVALADAWAALLDALASLQEGAAAEPAVRIDAAAFRRALAEELDRGASAALPAGAVAVCPIGALRGVPYRVVCLFGMDEAAFPRRARRSEFDLMRLASRFGDRVARADDRGTFLDAVLAAGERLIVVYQGRDARDDSRCNPSTLVSELLEYVAERHARGTDAVQVRRHPLHPFSPRNFHAGDGAAAPAFASEWLATARALATPLAARPQSLGPLVAVSVAEPLRDAGEAAEPTIALAALRDALADPAREWLRRTAGIRLSRDDGRFEEAEPLWVDADRDTLLVDRAANRLLAGRDGAQVLRELQASPQTAAGGAGELHARATLARAEALLAQARARPAGAAPRPAVFARLRLPADAPAPEVAVLARLTGIDDAGGQVVVSAFRLGMHAVVDAWLRHAAWVRWLQLEAPEADWCALASTRLVAADRALEFTTADPLGDLRHAVQWALRIRARPLALMPRTTLEWFRKGRSESAAREALFGDAGGFRSAELDRPWAAALHRDSAPDLQAVLQSGEVVYGRILAACGLDREPRRGKG